MGSWSSNVKLSYGVYYLHCRRKEEKGMKVRRPPRPKAQTCSGFCEICAVSCENLLLVCFHLQFLSYRDDYKNEIWMRGHESRELQ